MEIYFDYPENATQARAELISMGVPEREVRLRIHEGGGNPVLGVKRAIGHVSAERSHGATVIVDETDWIQNEKVLEVARRHDGKVSG